MLGIGLRLQRNVILHSNNTQYSPDPNTIVDPSGDIATEVTVSECPCSVFLISPETASQIFTVLSPTDIHLEITNKQTRYQFHKLIR